MSKTICYHLATGMVFCLAAAHGAETPAKFLGANSCASSSCHGGGGANQNQFLVWSLKDFHSQRPVATLATARAKQIADALAIKDAAADERCTSCHAPLSVVPENLRGKAFKVSEGVSCESCHGPAENWLRAHTRTDYTHADRTAAGMRDLENLYVRANTCVACHQNVDADILAAGHPELIFELDGQSVAEPKHWRAEKGGNGAQAWLVGQAIALRETSWELARESSPTGNEINRWRCLVWLMSRVSAIDSSLSAPLEITFRPNKENYELVQKWADGLATSAAKNSWTDRLSKAALMALAKTSDDFNSASLQPVLSRRAERMVLALDRLVTALPEARQNEPLNAALKKLFDDAQSLPDFKPAEFADHLAEFQKLVPASKP